MTRPAESLVLADGRVIERGGMLRRLSGKREVFEGWLDRRHVLVKQYLDHERGKVHAAREVKGLQAFAVASITTPELLYHDADSEGNPLVVLSYVEAATTYSAAWRDAGSEDREGLVRRMMRLLARHHAAGLCQTDLHLDNFLVTGDAIYSLDGAGVHVSAKGLKEKASLENLALFCAQLPPTYDHRSVACAADYAAERDWGAAPVTDKLPALIDAARYWRWRKVSEKAFRDCTAVRHLKTATSESLVVRSYLPVVAGVLSDLDSTCPPDAEDRLKDGNTATVWDVKTGGLTLVVKRYNIKNWRHGFTRLVRESRASISWRNAHRLALFGINTPAPVACVTERRVGMARVAYFLAERVEGPNLADWVERNRSDEQALAWVADHLAEIFRQMRRWRISHGDMKATNFIVAADGVYLIDLDVMRQHRTRSGFERAWKADMQRFLANWAGSGLFDDLIDDVSGAG